MGRHESKTGKDLSRMQTTFSMAKEMEASLGTGQVVQRALSKSKEAVGAP